MITLFPISDRERISALWKENNLPLFDDCGCLEVQCDSETLGYSLYRLSSDAITVCKIVTDDRTLTDGILRSTLHLAAERNITNAFYSGDDIERICKLLGFIKDESEKTLNINKLFESCRCGTQNA